jgi:hypothetical protein
MARPKSTKPLKDKRIPFMLSQAELEAIDDWRFSHRVGTRAESIRRLIILGLRSSKDIGSVKLENELEAEFEKRCAEDPRECPSAIWEDVCAEWGIA